MRITNKHTSLPSTVNISINNSVSLDRKKKRVSRIAKKRLNEKMKRRLLRKDKKERIADNSAKEKKSANSKKTADGYDEWTVLWHCDLKMKLARVGSAAEIISTAEANVRAARPVQTYVPPPVTQVVPSPAQSDGGMLLVAPSTPQETSVPSEEDRHLDADISPQRVTPNLTRTGAPVRHSIMKRKLIDIHIA